MIGLGCPPENHKFVPYGNEDHFMIFCEKCGEFRQPGDVEKLEEMCWESRKEKAAKKTA